MQSVNNADSNRDDVQEVKEQHHISHQETGLGRRKQVEVLPGKNLELI